MDHFHDRDLTGHGYRDYSPLVSFWTLPSQSGSPRRTHLPSLHSSFCLTHSAPGPITPPEDKASLREEHEAVKDFKSPYNQVREYVDHFKDWCSGVKIVPGSLDTYMRNLSINTCLFMLL